MVAVSLIPLNGRHPYHAITQFVLEWIQCLVSEDYDVADNLIDQFESDVRIADYFDCGNSSEDGQIRLIEPQLADWWEISFNQSRLRNRETLVEADVPLSGDYRAMKACFIFRAEDDGLHIVFQYCKPS